MTKTIIETPIADGFAVRAEIEYEIRFFLLHDGKRETITAETARTLVAMACVPPRPLKLG